MRLSRAMLLALVATVCFNLDARAEWWKPSMKKFWKSDSTATAPPSTTSQPSMRTASSNNSRVPTPSQQSNLTFAPAPGAPQPSVSIPAATSPAGPVATNKPKRTWGSRFSGAATATRNALTFKPREVPANDPVRLSGQPATPHAGVSVSAARVYESQGRVKEAREQYEKALKADPKHADALVGLARLLHREGDLASATDLYQRALQSHPNNPVVLNDLGLCYARRGMLDPARQSMEQAIAQDPRSKLYRNNLAVVLVEMNQPEAAFEHLQVVHGDAVAHYNLGYMLREKGQSAAAAQHLQTALAIEPRMEPARQLLAQMGPAPAPANGPQLGEPQMDRAQPQPQYAMPESQPRRDYPVNYRQESAPQDYGPPQNQNYPPPQNYGPPQNQTGPQNYAPPSQYQQPPVEQPPVERPATTEHYDPAVQGYLPTQASGAQMSLSDDQQNSPRATTLPPPNPHQPTVNYVQPPMNPAQPPANYVFPPAQPVAAQAAVEQAPQEAPVPGEMPAYLRGPGGAQPASPQAQPTEPVRASRWSN